MITVAVLDYGVGNIRSIRNAVEVCGAKVRVTKDHHELNDAEALVLPGVGAFPHAMKQLGDMGLIDPVMRFASSGRPLLGICLGMQMLADSGNEFCKTQGLGLIPGEVSLLPKPEQERKLPFVAWSGVHKPDICNWDGTILKDFKSGNDCYFVHSYAFVPDSEEDVLAESYYYGHRYVSAIRHGNVMGTQFHPEKSGKVGLQILESFIQLAEV